MECSRFQAYTINQSITKLSIINDVSNNFFTNYLVVSFLPILIMPKSTKDKDSIYNFQM